MSTLYVKQIGKGSKNIVLLHGWGNTHQILEPLGRLLANDACVHLVDLPGFGKTPPPPTSFTAKNYAQVIEKYCRENRLNQVILIGHSFGGKIAVCFASLYPNLVTKLILISSSGLKGKKKTGIRLLGKAIKLIDKFFKLQLFKSYFIPRFASKDWINAKGLRPILVRSVNEDISSLIAAIKQPTLLLWGKRDFDTPLKMGETFHSLIKNSKLIVYPQAGHHPFLETGSHLCYRHIHDFIESKNE